MQVLRAILLMILSMVFLALSDMFVKLAATRVPQGQIMLAISLGGMLLFIGLARLNGMSLLRREAFHPMVNLRNACEAVAGFGLVFGVTYVPLSTFAAIMQVAPILVVLGGAVFLREKVGWRRWAAVFTGLVGMLIVIRPGTEGFSFNVLYAVVGVSALAARDLITRLAPADVPALALSGWGFAATVPTSLLVLWWQGGWVGNDPIAWAHLIGAIAVTSTGYLLLTTAMRMAPVSIVAPFRYTRLIFTTGLGLLVFGETLDGPTMLGSGIILCAGLYTFFRERRLALAGTS